MGGFLTFAAWTTSDGFQSFVDAKERRYRHLKSLGKSANNVADSERAGQLRHTHRHKLGLLLPAVTWLFIQFTMSGIVLSSSADAMQIEICSPFGIQQITIDPETGEESERPVGAGKCDWCQSFGLIVDTAERGEVGWAVMARSFQHRLTLSPPPHKPLRLVADYQSRAPPSLVSHEL